ncbi:MAG: SRPBCC family protein [Verrucomicrobia bacterium]|nr:SRPBCC family protein [Verrucomicrobiota bacterium]
MKLVFQEDWSVLSYFRRPVPWLDGSSPGQQPREFALLLTMSLPFLWVGVMLCLKRLRSARLPLWLAVLFVVPVLKWFLFVALGLVPGREIADSALNPRRDMNDRWRRWLPKSASGSAAVAVGLSTIIAVPVAVFGMEVLSDYGWGLFVGLPFCMGFMAAVIHGIRQRRSIGESFVVGILSAVLAAAALLALAFEGVICILMAAPLAGALAILGALAGHAVQASRWRDTPPQLYCVPLLAMPLMLASDHLRAGLPPLLKVTTTIEVAAPPERVWRHVVSFTELPPPTDPLFKLGIAYPLRAEIRGTGAGATRHCVFSTGPFVEPIEIWDQPRLLKFSVTHNPAPMQEWTPYRHVHPPHLDGFLVSRQGQFLLVTLAGGRTRLEGTTWYHHTMWPADYWQLWSDYIIHRIHLRVLRHVKQLAESDPL